MRCFKKDTPKPFETRTITKFAILPVLVDNEYRCFETVTIRQEYVVSEHGWSDGWVNIKFVD